MKENKMTLRVVLSIAMIFMLFLTTAVECKAKPIAPNISQQIVANPNKPPTKVLGTPGLLGTVPWWIHDFIDKLKIKFFPCQNFELGNPGCNPVSGGNNKPTLVKMPGFFMFESLVTNAEYAACEEAGVCTPPGTSDSGPCSQYRNKNFADMPVVCVNWFQANNFCKWAEASLPTAAQWEEGTCGKPGNVREWMNDWYSASPQKIGLFDPSGPSEGKLKLVRGVSSENAGFAPDSPHGDVGFRCAPETPEYAPFCPRQVTPLCSDPNAPSSDQPCTTAIQKGGGKTSISNFGCPADGRVSITFNSNGGGNTGFNAMVNGQVFTCTPSSEGDTFVCTGPQQRMGSMVDITVCGGGATMPTLVPTLVPSGTQPTPVPAGGSSKGGGQNCPPGFIWQPPAVPAIAGIAAGNCVLDKTTDCPNGWFLSALLNCQPRDEKSCPPGTQWDAKLRGCVPIKDCPEGFILTEKKTCEPRQNDRKLCPAGYFYNKDIECCQPIRGDNLQCDANHYFDPNYKRCMPKDGNGCGFNFVYDCFGRCVGQPYQNPQSAGDGRCPGNLTFAAPNVCNTPSGGYDDSKPDPNRLKRPGDVLTAEGLITSGDNKNCGSGATFAAAFNTCISRDENKCPYGYHFDAEKKSCVPDNGPGSGCPDNYAFEPKLGCCAPIPGFDASRCPEDSKSAAGAKIDTSDPKQVFGITNFNPMQGNCGPLISGNGQPPQCPPGYLATNAALCTFNQNPNSNLPGCGPDEYFDKYLGYCVHLQPDCCPLGESFSAFFGKCAPDVGNPPRDGRICADGYELADGECLLIGRENGGQCVRISVNVPTCYGPCKVGYAYNPVTKRCEKPNPCLNVDCRKCMSTKSCPPGCCT